MKTIMIVDDEEDQIFSIKTALKKFYGEEYEITSAENGEKCLDLLEKKEKPDLILLDIMMPGMSGWEVFDKIRANPDLKEIPIVFLTARSDEIAEKAGRVLGDDYIEKPVSVDELKKRIDKILNKKQQAINSR